MLLLAYAVPGLCIGLDEGASMLSPLARQWCEVPYENSQVSWNCLFVMQTHPLKYGPWFYQLTRNFCEPSWKLSVSLALFPQT